MSLDAIVYLVLPETGLWTASQVRFKAGTEYHSRKVARALERLASRGFIRRVDTRYAHLRSGE